jgi:hypothetical protein
MIAPKGQGGQLFARALVGIGAASVLGLFLGGHRARAQQANDDGAGE